MKTKLAAGNEIELDDNVLRSIQVNLGCPGRGSGIVVAVIVTDQAIGGFSVPGPSDNVDPNVRVVIHFVVGDLKIASPLVDTNRFLVSRVIMVHMISIDREIMHPPADTDRGGTRPEAADLVPHDVNESAASGDLNSRAISRGVANMKSFDSKVALMGRVKRTGIQRDGRVRLGEKGDRMLGGPRDIERDMLGIVPRSDMNGVTGTGGSRRSLDRSPGSLGRAIGAIIPGRIDETVGRQRGADISPETESQEPGQPKSIHDPATVQEPEIAKRSQRKRTIHPNQRPAKAF